MYPIKTLRQLPLFLKAFRKERKLAQAAMAEKLGITQQNYAYFEGNPARATVERVFLVHFCSMLRFHWLKPRLPA